MHLRNHVQHLLDRISRLKQLRAIVARKPDYIDKMLDLEDIDRDLHMCKIELNSTYSARSTPSEYRMAELAKDAHQRGLRLHDFVLRGKSMNENKAMAEDHHDREDRKIGAEAEQLKQSLIALLSKFYAMGEALDEPNKDLQVKTEDGEGTVIGYTTGSLGEAWPFPRQAMPELAVFEDKPTPKDKPKQPQTVSTTCLKSNLPPPAALPEIPPSLPLVR